MKEYTFPRSKLIVSILLIGAIFNITNSCKKSSSRPGAGSNEVFIERIAFNPSTITVAAGTSIIWTNKDAGAHTVTSNTGIFDSGSINTNGTFSYTFSTVGSFLYHCSIHSYMTVKVIVQ